MVHVDPHTIKIIPATAKRFMGAQRYAVVGRILQDPARFDNKVIRWYQERKMPVSLVRPASDKFDNSKPIEGIKAVEKVVSGLLHASRRRRAGGRMLELWLAPGL
jgi:hypothetical protein